MTEQRESVGRARLPSTFGRQIDRTEDFSFRFDGREIPAFVGDTIASALAAAGVQTISRSFKYHRPRGILCGSGHCPNCLVQVGDEPNVRSCRRPAEPDLDVSSQNAWPSLNLDLMEPLTALGDSLLPVGFYYKAFIRPRALWPTFENAMRQAAGLGKVSPVPSKVSHDKEYLHEDLVVVGGGPAGLKAALAAADAGVEVALFDDEPALGGHLRYAGPGSQDSAFEQLLASVAGHDRIRCFLDSTVLGWYEENWLSAVQGERLYKIRARSVVFATGAIEQPTLFLNNDLPGVMLGSAVQRLIHLYGVRPGRRALVATASDYGWHLAQDLLEAGVHVVAIADERAPPEAAPLDLDIPAFWAHALVSAQGSRRVNGAVIGPMEDRKRTGPQLLDCDLIVLSGSWSPANGLIYQSGGQIVYNEALKQYLPHKLPPGIFAAGRALGIDLLPNQLADGERAGQEAVAFLLSEEEGDSAAEADELQGAAIEPDLMPPASGAASPDWGKQFVCFCEDVTRKDVKTAIEEGYDSLELLKRYSTVSMGPCQGGMCSRNTIDLCAQLTSRTVPETGTTTARPPMHPVKLGVLAGQNMEPVRVTPVHHWHHDRGATMMVAGLWLRPEHYGDPAEEVRAVRERVGLIDVSTLGKLWLTGTGVPDLLDRIYVNKWQKLAVGRVRYGVMCNDEGIVLDDGVTARLGDAEWFTTTTSSGAGSIHEWIEWWAQSGWGNGVHINNVSENYAAFNLAGPRAREVLAALTDEDVSGEAFPYMHVRAAEVASVPCQILRIGFTGELSYEIHCPAPHGLHVWEALIAAGERFGILPFGVEAQRVLRLEKAHIIVGQDTDALSDPISADMDWIVKHDKQDFLGNRILARVARKGSTQRLVGFKMAQRDLVPEEGLQIVARKEDGSLNIIGWVTSSRLSPTLGYAIGLCWLSAELAARKGAEFTIRRNGELLKARVHHGPFYDPAGHRLRM